MTIPASTPACSPPLRRALLVGCAIGGLCLAATQLGAQAFNATPKTVAGGVLYDRATPGVETIFIDTSTAIINWTPNVSGNPIIFLPAGNVATFTNGINTTDFVVLNRILTNTPIRFDGNVLSIIQDFAVSTSRPGGTVIFSSPGGIIIGPNAVFDVGSLVLTSLNVVDDGAGNFYDPATRGMNFAPFGGAPANGAVITLPGSQIRALEQSSFVAIVAPQVQHGGSVRVNGSAAYIAGENVQMRVNQGLFDIIVDVGSDNAVPLIHTGSTGGPASTGAADPHAIYMVAMPKNQAITAILQGDVGFDPAVDAAIENGVIVLSAGANVVGGQVDRYGDLTGMPAADLAASFLIQGGTIRSDLFGTARTDMRASAAGSGTLTFLQDVSLFGGASAHISAASGQNVTVMGNALVSAAAFDSANPAMFNLVGGDAGIFTTGGAIRIFGSATVDASARGLVDASNNAGSGTGGTAGVIAAGGTIQIDGALAILATGEGGIGAVGTTGNGGAGFGGNAGLAATAAGSVVANGGVTMNANGTASASDGAGGVDGAIGRGGNLLVAAAGGGTLTLAGPFAASASGQGGEVQGGPGLLGGLGDGGSIIVRSQSGTIRFNGNAAFLAAGTGGSGPEGGRGQGGDLLIEATGGTIDFAAGTNGGVGGLGGDAAFGPGGTGGVGQGGTVRILAHTGPTPSRIGGGAFTLTAPGTGGRGGGWAGGPTNGGTGGLGSGGAITILAESGNGTIDLGALKLDAVGTGGSGGNADNNNNGGAGGIGDGGDILVGTIVVAGSGAPSGGARFASADLDARGIGGAGGNGRGAGGMGQGGTATLSAAGAPLTLTGAVSLVGDGIGGTGGDSPGAGFGATGSGAGGQVALNGAGAGGTLTAGAVVGTANGAGGTAAPNTPGQWHVTATGGGGIVLTNLTLSATAGNPAAAIPFSSVEMLGGTVNVAQVAALDTLGEIRVIADGAGRILGGGWTFAAGQDVVMSHANPVANGFTIDVTDLFVRAGDDVLVNAGVVTRTSNLTDIRAVDLATVAGRLLGRQITVGSADIDIQATGGIGDGATGLVVLDVAGGVPPSVPGAGQFTTLGGAAQGPGYTLTGAEAGRIRAGILRILAPALSANPARAPDVLVRDLVLNGGGAAAGIGMFEIVTPGILRVEGGLLMAGARAQDGISIRATDRLEVATPTGGIRVRDAAGAPGGTMILASNNIWVASAAIIDLLRANPNYAGRDDDLIDNGGTEVPRGYVEADGVTLASGGTLYVQNSGSGLPFSTDYAGITVGPTGLTILAAAPGTNVTAFGRRLNADGSFTTGNAFFDQSTYLTAGGAAGVPGSYTATAALNTCIIVTGQCPARAPKIPLPGGRDPTLGPTGGSQAIPLPAGADEDDLVDTSFASDPLIEEPVTSGSETGQWDCPDPDNDGDCEEPND